MANFPNYIVFVLSLSCLLCVDVQASETLPVDPVVLRIAGWDVYGDPENHNKTIGYESFENRYGARIEFTPLTNLDDIIATAESGDQYDIFIISNEGVKILHDMKLIRPLDLGKIPNYDNLYASLKYSEWCQFGARVYAVPWAWGPTGLVYDADQVQTPDSWNVLWDPKYQHKVALWDDLSMIWITALSLGHTNVYNLTRPQLNEVREKLLALNNQVFGYYKGELEELDYIRNKGVVLLNSWFDPSNLLKEEGRNFKMVIPREGAIGMFDSYMISNNSTHPDLAYQYINHQINPAVQQAMVRTTGLPPANIQTLEMLSPEEIKALHLDEADYFNRMILWDVVPRRHMYKQLLDDIKQDFAARQSDLSN
jgi:spermidine/putrescine-binding protein